MSCGAKFYDLDRDPAICPKCGTIYQAVATSRMAPPTIAARPADEEEETDEKGPEIVSLDEVEQAEEDADAAADDEADADADTSDTFLEEEDSDDDVSDLIDNDVETDEEG